MTPHKIPRRTTNYLLFYIGIVAVLFGYLSLSAACAFSFSRAMITFYTSVDQYTVTP